MRRLTSLGGGGLLGIESGRGGWRAQRAAWRAIRRAGRRSAPPWRPGASGSHLLGDFFEDVVDAREVLLRGFEAEFGQTFLGFEAGDAGGFFDDAAAIQRLGAEELADALLADDGVDSPPSPVPMKMS